MQEINNNEVLELKLWEELLQKFWNKDLENTYNLLSKNWIKVSVEDTQKSLKIIKWLKEDRKNSDEWINSFIQKALNSISESESNFNFDLSWEKVYIPELKNNIRKEIITKFLEQITDLVISNFSIPKWKWLWIINELLENEGFNKEVENISNLIKSKISLQIQEDQRKAA